MRGTKMHELAGDLIKFGVKLDDNGKTMNSYVNDAIGFRMKSEQPLFYSMNCFGTADAIGFRDDLLRIHDLKTGLGKTSMRQLEVYSAMFCLEYLVRPSDISIELRIYQSDEIFTKIPELDDIVHIMDRIVTFDKRIDNLRKEALS